MVGLTLGICLSFVGYSHSRVICRRFHPHHLEKFLCNSSLSPQITLLTIASFVASAWASDDGNSTSEALSTSAEEQSRHDELMAMLQPSEKDNDDVPSIADLNPAREGAPVLRIVLTGGPCGGKTTAMAFISERLRSLGFRVYRVPEAASLLLNGSGVRFDSMNEDEVFSFQLSLIRMIIAMEDAFVNIARSSNHASVIISDRGTMDPMAYMSVDQWQVLLDESNWNLVELRDKRYDAIIHLVTAAIGAEKYYTTENNTARTETMQEARELDVKVLNAWIGHPQLRIIDNSTDFRGKIHRTANVICQLVGAPRGSNLRRRFISCPVSLGISRGCCVYSAH